MPYNHLFQPLQIGSRTVRNRIVSTPHATGHDADGLITEREILYHARKAAGGVGLVMVFGSASVHRRSVASFGSIHLWDPRNEEPLRRLAELTHQHGALIISQATHMGRRGNTLRSGGALWAPSPVAEPVHREIPHEMTIEEIEEVIHAFAEAARRLERCGFDGIEITSFGGHLIEQFWSPKANRRSDKYGGSFENRMRFVTEVLQAVAEAVSPDFIISFRMTGDPLTDAIGLTQRDMIEIARYLDSLGIIKLLSVSGGTGATLRSQAATVPPVYYPSSCYNHLARAIREVVRVPVLVAGRILTAEEAEQALANGDCDLVAMTRAIIADPDLPRKIQSGESQRVRPCISINQECIGRLYQGLPIRCAVNPGVLDERIGELAPLVGLSRHIVVVGGGPAGMEAARVAAARGHRVTLLEKETELGGQLRAALRLPHRPLYERYLDWLERELSRLGVDIRLHVTAQPESVLGLQPDVVIIATGAKASIPQEWNSSEMVVRTDFDVLRDTIQVSPDTRVVVYDLEGHVRGAYAALWAAAHGAKAVSLVTDLISIGELIDPTQKPSIYRLLAEYRVNTISNVHLVRVERGQIVLENIWDGTRSELECDLLIITGTYEAEWTLYRELKEKCNVPIHLIGDALAPRRLYDAVAEGTLVGNSI